MKCRDCPYGKYDFESRMKKYIYLYESGDTKLLYGLLPEEVSDEIEEFIKCEKVGGKVYWAGHCSDFYEEDVNTENIRRSNKKKRNKRERYLKYKNHLKRLEHNGSYRCRHLNPVTYTDEVWIKGQGWIENHKPHYKRWYRGKRSKYLKNQSNRKIRRYKGEIHNGYQCHKLYDYWWELT